MNKKGDRMPRRGKFLFVLLGVDGGGGGQLTPAFALIRRLVRRGHEIRVMGPPALAQRVRELGATFVGFELLPQPTLAQGAMVEEYIDELFAFTCSSVLTKDVLNNLEGMDVLAVDCMVPAASFAGELRRTPTALLVHTLYQWYTEGIGADVFSGIVAPFVRQARLDLGLPGLLAEAPLMPQLMDSGTLALALTLQEFDSPLSRSHSNLRYVGPVLDEVAPKWEPPGQPLVLVSFSTTYMRHEDALRRTFEALNGIDAFAVCTLGHAFSRERIPAFPNVSVYDWLPHDAILPHAAAVVTHAGHSTVMAALAHVPLVCMPMGRDQDTNAERVGAVGAGITLSPAAAPAEIGAAIKNVLTNPSYRDAASRLAAQIGELGRGGRAVTELEGLLR
jgi:MGT family glycosyltransferase